MIACMGGFCRKREYCSHYHASERQERRDRLCIPGADGVGADVQVVIRMPVGAWERNMFTEAKDNGRNTGSAAQGAKRS